MLQPMGSQRVRHDLVTEQLDYNPQSVKYPAAYTNINKWEKLCEKISFSGSVVTEKIFESRFPIKDRGRGVDIE